MVNREIALVINPTEYKSTSEIHPRASGNISQIELPVNYTQSRQKDLKNLLLNGHEPGAPLVPIVNRNEIRVLEDNTPTITVLVPIHDCPRRIALAPAVFKSIREQGDNMHLVIADNGLSSEALSSIQRAAQDENLSLTVADARPNTNLERGPAFARNKGLQAINHLREQNASLRGPVLELDSDGLLMPGAARSMRETLSRNNTVAVSGNIVPVKHLNPETISAQKEVARHYLEEGKIRVLPSLWKPDGRIDLAAIVAFSSQIAGKTTGLMIHPDTLHNITKYTDGKLYVTLPNQGYEDMMASTAFNRQGHIYLDSRARILDEARETDEQIHTQQFKWGLDQVTLTADLTKIGLTRPGLHILEPKGDSWSEWVVPHTENMTGFVINPDDVKGTAFALGQDIQSGEALYRFGSQEAVDVLKSGLGIVAQTLKSIDLARSNASLHMRDDLPAPIEQDPEHPRFSHVAKTAKLGGLLLGHKEILPNDLDYYRRIAQLPPVIMLGGRQAASWNK